MHRRFLCGTVCVLAAALSTSSVMAADDPATSEEAPLVVPKYPNEKPSWSVKPVPTPPSAPKYERYGYQILLPTILFDGLFFTGFLVAGTSSNSEVGLRLWVTGAIGRSLSGPIVHFAHGHIFRAAVSFGLESIWLPIVAPTQYAVETACPGAFNMGDERPNKCSANKAIALMVGIPFAFAVAGTLVDALVLAKDELPPKARTTSGLDFSISPYVVPNVSPDVRTGLQKPSLQFGFAGTF